MTTNDFNPEIINSNLNSVQYYLDNDGSLKFTAPALSSSNFDGMIPAVEDTINAEDLKSGMLLEVIDNVYYPVVSLAYDDPVFDTTPTNIITVGYIDSNNELNTIDYNLTDSVNVRYEDWDNKTLGNQGWTITSGGNAVFANVGIRGDLEATTLDVGGTSGITYDGSTVTIGASVIVNAPITFNGVTEAILSASLAGYIPDGSAAADIISNSTTITGGNIFTGTIQSQYYSYASGLYSNNGMQVGLDGNGYIRSPNFYLDTSGNAYFRGTINAFSGFFGSESTNWSIGTETAAGYTSAFMKSGTLKLYTATTGTPAVQHGIITLDNGSGLSAGSLSNALSVPANKTVNALGNGLHIGTGADYLFIPGTGNALSPRIRSNGFEFRNDSESIAFKVGNDEISIPAATTINFWNDSQSPAAYLDYGPTNNQLVIGVGAGPGGSTFNGIVNFRASDVRLNGTSIVGGGGGGGGVTSFKFGDTGATETGAVAITGAEIITAINPNSIGNGKLANSTIQIMSTTKSLGQSFVAGDIDGDVLTANSVSPGKIANTLNLFSIGGTGVVRGATVSTITGPLTIGNPATGNALTVNGGLNNGLSVPTARGLDYTMNFGTSLVSLNRASTAMTLTGVTVDGLSLNTALFTLGSTAITAGNTVANFGLNYNWYLGTTAISLGRANAAATLTGITLSGAKITTPPTGATSQNFLRWNSGTNDITQTSSNTPPSSIRFKEIIQRNPFLETSWIDEIEIVTFKYNQEKEWYGDNAPERLGLIAEEIENIPSINKTVEYNNVSGLAEGIDYDKIALLLIPEIKLLRQRVADLEARLDAAGL